MAGPLGMNDVVWRLHHVKAPKVGRPKFNSTLSGLEKVSYQQTDDVLVLSCHHRRWNSPGTP